MLTKSVRKLSGKDNFINTHFACLPTGVARALDTSLKA